MQIAGVAKGVLMRVGSALAFSMMATVAKLTGGVYPIGQIVFFRSLFALVVLVFWLRGRGEFPHAIRTHRPLGHLGRGLAGTCGMFSYFLAVALLPLPDVTAIGYLAPLLVVALAALVLGETVRAYRWGAVIVGFLGALIILRPGVSPLNVGHMTALVSTISGGVSAILVKQLTQRDDPNKIVFLTHLFLAEEEGPVGSELAGRGTVDQGTRVVGAHLEEDAVFQIAETKTTGQ